MGTDITILVIEPDGWTSWFYGVDRDYSLYKYLGYDKYRILPEPYHKSRGFPMELPANEALSIYSVEAGDHNPSWMTADEFAFVKNRYEYEFSFDGDKEPYVWPYDHILDKARQTNGKIVFWFNS